MNIKESRLVLRRGMPCFPLNLDYLSGGSVLPRIKCVCYAVEEYLLVLASVSFCLIWYGDKASYVVSV